MHVIHSIVFAQPQCCITNSVLFSKRIAVWNYIVLCVGGSKQSGMLVWWLKLGAAQVYQTNTMAELLGNTLYQIKYCHVCAIRKKQHSGIVTSQIQHFGFASCCVSLSSPTPLVLFFPYYTNDSALTSMELCCTLQQDYQKNLFFSGFW